MAHHQSYVPSTNEGIGLLLSAFSNGIAADNGALATKYGVAAAEVASVTQASLVWNWFEAAVGIARGWSSSITGARDALSTGTPGTFDPMPVPVSFPPVPTLPGPPVVPVQIEHDFFTAFSALVSRIKKNVHYDVADGKLLGIEGVPQPPPNPAIVPRPTMEIFTSGHPEVSCVKGVFQGFDVYLTRPGAVQKLVGTSMGRRYMVNEPLPAPGMAEVWLFAVQYRYKNAPFGQMSQPVSVTVRG